VIDSHEAESTKNLSTTYYAFHEKNFAWFRQPGSLNFFV